MVPPDVADDIVAEAFARVLAAIRAGGGPSHAFRGYLLTAVRNLAHDWLQTRNRLTVVADMDVQADDKAAGAARVNPGIGSAAETQAEARDEARLVTRAFGRLPARWRAVLWQLEVEGKTPAAVAPMFGLSANGVSALAMRAREGLRQAYLDEHVGANLPVACRTYAAEFGAGARGRLSQRRRAAMQEHLGHCPPCQDLFTELTELNSRLGTILTPAALAAASSALGSAKRATVLRTSLTGQWRTWRWHPVTTVTGAVAGVAVAGGMLLAVNVTPAATPPAHAATLPATQPALPAGLSGPFARKRGFGGGGGGPGSPMQSVPASLTSAGFPPGPGFPPGAGSPPGAASAIPPDGSTPGAPATDPTQASQPPSGHTTTVTSAPGDTAHTITGTAGATVTGLANTAGGTVTGLANTAGATVTGVTDAASGLVDTTANAVSGVASTAGNAVSGVTGAAGATVAAAGSAVSDVTSTAANAVSGVASTAGNAVAGVTSTAGNAVSGVASTAGNAVSGAAGAAGATVAAAGSAVSDVTSTAANAVAGVTNAAATATNTTSTASSPASTVSSAAAAPAKAAATAATSTANTAATATSTVNTVATAAKGLSSAVGNL